MLGGSLRTRTLFLLLCLGLAIAIIPTILYLRAAKSPAGITMSALSPSNRYRALLVERPAFIDRNFDVVILDVDTDNERTIFTSPDEGRPIGSERFLWSRDDQYLLLLGRNFFVAEAAVLDSGEQMYLLHHLPTGGTWCNATQADIPRFDATILRELGLRIEQRQAGGK